MNEFDKPLIEVKGLKKSFVEGTTVLNDVSTTIYQGEKVVVIGPSGCGKSTFLRCINCLEDPNGGQIIFEDVDIADPKVDINIHRQNIGMVFQQFNLFNNKTILQNIMPSAAGAHRISRCLQRAGSLCPHLTLPSAQFQHRITIP